VVAGGGRGQPLQRLSDPFDQRAGVILLHLC
jgi:hypothetical protein